MSRLVDADMAQIYLNMEACEQIELMPTVDAVEVVRCKDCKYFQYGDYCAQEKMEHSKCRDEDFCSYGVPREE